MTGKVTPKLVRQIVLDNNLDVRVTAFPGGDFNLTGPILDVLGVHEILRGMGYPVLIDQDTNTALVLG